MTWYRKLVLKNQNRKWDRTAASMILQLVTESGHPVFGASGAFERGKLDIKEHGKKSTRFDDNVAIQTLEIIADEKARCSLGGNVAISETGTSTTSTASTTKSAIRRRRKLRILCRSQNLMAVLQRAMGEICRPHLHLQLRSGQLHNGKRVGADGNLHHLRNGGNFGFLERIPENRREV